MNKWTEGHKRFIEEERRVQSTHNKSAFVYPDKKLIDELVASNQEMLRIVREILDNMGDDDEVEN